MQQQLSDVRDEGLASATESSQAVCDEPPAEERWPTAGELHFEAGLVLVGALSVAFAMELLLTLMGIPHPV